ncbi:5-oxoprolinase subunit C family protein [Helicobacter labacensis]|uniref:5-oxoprolinase subunit C family protein n=1 Tax=Helicobacter labacensis TaxID=2316079 RepID=UPI000EB05BC3|nr:biotin-dependent carboxyltransferase family protein [Helicobacter labacensis]
MANIKVLEAGLFTSIQDLGRRAYMRFGIPIGGVMDEFSAVVANFLVGNEAQEALLEMTYTGTRLEFLESMHIAITGANLNPQINDQDIANWESHDVKKGDILSFGRLGEGVRAYVAFSGTIDVPVVCGSKATDVRTRMGGLQGRVLQNGDVLNIIVRPEHKLKKVPQNLQPHYPPSASLWVLLGPQEHYFNPASLSDFLSMPYTIKVRSNRMGICLEGQQLAYKEHIEMISEPLVVGSIQVPSDGQPIVLMADCQTMGGYPKIATLLKNSLGTLAQMRPNDKVSFVAVSMQEAQKKYQEFYARLHALRAQLKV